MKSLEQWFEEYGESHQNLTNQKIHKVAVPGIFFSVAGFLWLVPSLSVVGVSIAPYFIVLAFVLGFYAMMSLKAFIVMTAFSMFCTLILVQLQHAQVSVLVLSSVLFVLLWILQFVGHHIEGKKPSFFKDIQFLLIGPAWVFHFFFPLTKHDS
ncbi:Mpo1 family 2-hydroxy fatty acid dioxygenase [Enterovibrio norvegicus]|uniref:Mpo1 family 2-hydroxy fatty acid dioxygenase n=1 Tax=Enterovibrio norvegicus TaxID=188144 RepID=UPI00354C795D